MNTTLATDIEAAADNTHDVAFSTCGVCGFRYFARQECPRCIGLRHISGPFPPMQCECCGKTYTPQGRTMRLFHRRACSPACRVGLIATRRSSPPSTFKERARARKWICQQVGDGGFPRPTKCSRCGAESRIDAHHPDYQQKDLVHFLCCSCHLLAHYKPSTLDGLTPTRIPAANRPHPGKFKKGQRSKRWDHRKEGPSDRCLKAVEVYRANHPGATWRDIYLNVPNHYANAKSMKQNLRCAHLAEGGQHG